MRILVTGAAGFIGGNLLSTLKNANLECKGVDSFSTYYSPDMKLAHITSLNLKNDVIGMDINARTELQNLFRGFQPSHVVHLAAQGGVRASRNDPWPYLSTNQIGFQNIVELCENDVLHLHENSYDIVKLFGENASEENCGSSVGSKEYEIVENDNN
jgi:UDP-glucuronate 4-epimerase